MKSKDIQIENSGNSSGVLVADNNGVIQISMKETIKIPSLISKVVQSLGVACLDADISGALYSLEEYKPDEKITYNNVIRYKYIIKEYVTYYMYCDNFLNIYDDSNVRGKAKILRCIHLWYLEAKGQIFSENQDSGKDEMDLIRLYSDRIIDMVKDRIYDTVKNSDEFGSACAEDLELGIACFTCYCFMECKILEKPK